MRGRRFRLHKRTFGLSIRFRRTWRQDLVSHKRWWMSQARSFIPSFRREGRRHSQQGQHPVGFHDAVRFTFLFGLVVGVVNHVPDDPVNAKRGFNHMGDVPLAGFLDGF